MIFKSGIYIGFIIKVKIYSYRSIVRTPSKAFMLKEDMPAQPVHCFFSLLLCLRHCVTNSKVFSPPSTKKIYFFFSKCSHIHKINVQDITFMWKRNGLLGGWCRWGGLFIWLIVFGLVSVHTRNQKRNSTCFFLYCLTLFGCWM